MNNSSTKNSVAVSPELLQQCLAGEVQALDKLIRRIQGRIYNMAVRFYWNPPDAEDATQEILLRIITHLATFRGECSFETWTYRIASNYLINSRRRQHEAMTFDLGAYHLLEGLQQGDYDLPDRNILAEEVKIGCSTAMLTCLSRPLRLTYILAEISGFDSVEGAFILEIEAATFRKRLSLARQQVRRFMGQHCGLYDPENPCRCHKQIRYDLTIGRINPDSLLFADKGVVERVVDDVSMFSNEVAIFQTHPTYQTPDTVLMQVRELLLHSKAPVFTSS
jgi:RNA polymerase sigma factor (sigma-70 family)